MCVSHIDVSLSPPPSLLLSEKQQEIPPLGGGGRTNNHNISLEKKTHKSHTHESVFYLEY